MNALSEPITPPAPHLATAALDRLAGLAAPSAAGERLREAAAWIAATQNQLPPRQLVNVRLVVFAGDHDIGRFPRSASPSAAEVVRDALTGELALNSSAAALGVTVRVLDLGVDDDFADVASVTRAALQAFKVRRCTGAIDVEDALTDVELKAALAAGVDVAREEIDHGAQLLVGDVVGSGATTAANALVAAVLDLDTDGVSPRRGDRDRAETRTETALRRLNRRAADPIVALRALGGADLAACTGYLLTAARAGVPALLGSVIAVACGLVADRIAPGAAKWFIAGSRSAEPTHRLALAALDLEPVVERTSGLGSGAEALAALPLLRTATAMLTQTAQFGDLTAD